MWQIFWLWILSHQSLSHWRGPDNSQHPSVLSLMLLVNGMDLDTNTVNWQMCSVEHWPLWSTVAVPIQSYQAVSAGAAGVVSIMASPKHLKKVLAQEQGGYTVPETIKVRLLYLLKGELNRRCKWHKNVNHLQILHLLYLGKLHFGWSVNFYIIQKRYFFLLWIWVPCGQGRALLVDCLPIKNINVKCLFKKKKRGWFRWCLMLSTPIVALFMASQIQTAEHKMEMWCFHDLQK